MILASPRPRNSEQVCFIVLGVLFSFLKKFAQGPTRSCWRDVCGPYFWHLQYLGNCRLWLAVFTVVRSVKEARYRFEVSRKHRRLLFLFSQLGWFASVKWQNWVWQFFKISKEWTNTNQICIDVWRQTTYSGMYFPSI